MSQQPTGDWVVQVLDTIDRVVGFVRDNTTNRAVVVVRGLVYGLLAAILGLAVMVLLIVALLRVLDLLPIGVWFADLVGGGLLVLLGGLLMRMRHARAAD
jgi:uncharacterized membrane protein